MSKRLRPAHEITLASLIEKRQALRIACIPCGLDRHLSPLEAISTYGGQIAFQELAGVLRARCGKQCQLSTGPSVRRPDELIVKRHVP